MQYLTQIQARNEGLVDFGSMTMSALASGDFVGDSPQSLNCHIIFANATGLPAGTVEVMEEMVCETLWQPAFLPSPRPCLEHTGHPHAQHA